MVENQCKWVITKESAVAMTMTPPRSNKLIILDKELKSVTLSSKSLCSFQAENIRMIRTE